jgi:UDP-glucose 4-epimerase
VAAIVHQRQQQDRELYFRVNRDLPVDVCRQAVSQGVKHFVFLSSMAVYGKAPDRSGQGVVSPLTACLPSGIYGESKLAAEEGLTSLQREIPFTLSLIRPPMVYGPGCPGNYFKRLLWMGRYLPVFPDVRDNRLSMIGIRNLCELIRLTIETDAGGIFCPDDLDGYGTRERLRVIAEVNGRSLRFSKLLGLPLRQWPMKQLDALFGDLYYSADFNHFDGKYRIESFAEGIAGGGRGSAEGDAE